MDGYFNYWEIVKDKFCQLHLTSVSCNVLQGSNFWTGVRNLAERVCELSGAATSKKQFRRRCTYHSSVAFPVDIFAFHS